MSNFYDSALLNAAQLGDERKVRFLLKQGADPNASGTNSGALHGAIIMGHTKVVEILLKNGANPNIADKNNFYPLHLAARNGHIAICNRLIKANSKIEAKTGNGATALHIAAASGNSKTVYALIISGCNKEAKDDDGNTALSAACILGCHGVVKTLIKNNCAVNSINNKGNSCLLQALWSLYESRVDDWSHEGEKNGEAIKYVFNKGRISFLYNYKKFSNQEGRSMTKSEQREISKMSWCPKEYHRYLNLLKIIPFLIKSGADIHKKNNKRISPMRVACYSGVGEIIHILFKNGAEFETKPLESVTEMHLVAGSGREDGLETFLKLASAKDINKIDNKGWTPAHYLADTGGKISMASILIEHGADTSIESTKKNKQFPEGITSARVALHWKDFDMAIALDSQ